MVNSRIRLRINNSTSVISDRLISGSTSCSRVLNVVPLEDERTAPSDYATGAAGRTGVEGSSRDRRSVDDVLDHRIGGQAVTGGVRSQPQAMAEHVLREVLNVFRIDLVALPDDQRPHLGETAPHDDRARRRAKIDAGFD